MQRPAKKLTKKEVAKFKDLLLQHKRFLLGDVEMMEEDMDSTRQSSGSFSKIPTHPSDIGSDNFEQDFTYERIEAEGFEIKDINKALKKTEKGTYGICEMCNARIPKKRLQAIPYCQHCIECQEKTEKK